MSVHLIDASKTMDQVVQRAFKEHFKSLGWKEIALAVTAVVLLALGAVASAGLLDSLTPYGTYISYGMYGATILLLIAKSVQHIMQTNLMREEVKQVCSEFFQGFPCKAQKISILRMGVLYSSQFQANPIQYLKNWCDELAIMRWNEADLYRLSKDRLEELSIQVYVLSSLKSYPGALSIIYFHNHLLEEVSDLIQQFHFDDLLFQPLASDCSLDTAKDVRKSMVHHYRAQIMEGVKQIIQSPQFKQNPELEMKSWKDGPTKDFMLLSHARGFIKQYYQQDNPLYLHSRKTI